MMTAKLNVWRAARGAAALSLVCGVALALGGCVGQQTHDQLMDANRSLTERNGELVRANEELKSENGMLQGQRTASERALAELTRQNDGLKAQLSAAGKSYNDLDARLRGLQFGPVDQATDQALAALAAEHPDLIKYDQARGMLRFASDLTFGSGSDAVAETAKTSLNALAHVLTSTPAASQYELMIMGHTDAQRIGPSAAKHPTNVHLSAHRAISVRSALASMGVPADKMFVAGWGEFRPVAANGPKGESAQNRRVEIYLTKSSMSESELPPAPEKPAKPTKTSATKETAPSRQPDLTK